MGGSRTAPTVYNTTMFITLEGPDGSGKTSHIKPLAEWLTLLGYKVFTTREPGGTPIGEEIREVIHDLKHTDMHWRAETLLYQATRAQLVEQVIRPKLQDGFIGISDRYIDSTLAYQGCGHQQNLDEIRTLVNYATGGLMPDLTILLDIDVKVGLQRRADSDEWNRLDAYDSEFHQRVRNGYLQFAKEEPSRWIVVDANQNWEAVQGYIRNIVSKRIQILRTPA